MRSYSLLAAAALSGAALAVPLESRAAAVSMMADAAVWTITSLTRICDTADTLCTWTFGINDGTSTTPCTEVVNRTPTSPASQTNGGQVPCGDYSVTSGWSGYFGNDKGFTTFSVKNSKNLIVYPGYADSEIINGTAVQPDKSYTPQAIF